MEETAALKQTSAPWTAAAVQHQNQTQSFPGKTPKAMAITTADYHMLPSYLNSIIATCIPVCGLQKTLLIKGLLCNTVLLPNFCRQMTLQVPVKFDDCLILHKKEGKTWKTQ